MAKDTGATVTVEVPATDLPAVDDTASVETSVLGGLVKVHQGGLPAISGRGRVAAEVPADLAAELAASLSGESYLEFTGTENAINSHKRIVKRWEEANAAKVSFVTTGANGDTKTVAYAAKLLTVAAPVAAE